MVFPFKSSNAMTQRYPNAIGGVGVLVGVAVKVAVLVGVKVGVTVGVAVAVLVVVGVFDGVDVADAVGVGVKSAIAKSFRTVVQCATLTVGVVGVIAA